jgi:polyisoprenoid-binding protein YceI
MRIARRLSSLVAAAATAALLASPAAAQGAKAQGARSSTKGVAATVPAVDRAPAAALDTYKIDATHSELSFRIRHLLGRVNGGFGAWGGTIAIDSAAPANSRVDVTIQTASIDTKNTMRDNHLRSAEFFAADSFPTITFKSNKVAVQGKALTVYGDLTMHGRTKPVVLTGEYSGAFKDANGKQRTAFTASTTINRLNYGLAWNKAVETGSLLGDDVTIDIAVQAVRQ